MIKALISFVRLFLMTWVLLIATPMVLLCPNVFAADVEVTTAKLETADDGYRIFVGFSFELGNELKSTINEGIPISFTAEVEINRPRWYWFDEKTIHSSQTIKIQYDLWRRQYTAAVNGGIKQNFATLDEAMSMVLRSRRWVVADKNQLEFGKTYNVGVRIKLDSNQLSKPMLIKSLSSSDWRLSSEWKRFTFKVDDK